MEGSWNHSICLAKLLITVRKANLLSKYAPYECFVLQKNNNYSFAILVAPELRTRRKPPFCDLCTRVNNKLKIYMSSKISVFMEDKKLVYYYNYLEV